MVNRSVSVYLFISRFEFQITHNHKYNFNHTRTLGLIRLEFSNFFSLSIVFSSFSFLFLLSLVFFVFFSFFFSIFTLSLPILFWIFTLPLRSYPYSLLFVVKMHCKNPNWIASWRQYKNRIQRTKKPLDKSCSLLFLFCDYCRWFVLSFCSWVCVWCISCFARASRSQSTVICLVRVRDEYAR